MALVVKNPPANAGELSSLVREDPLEVGMATHSSSLAWRIPWTEEPAAAAKSLQLCPTLCDPMDLACQATLSMGFSRQEYWSGLPCPPPGDLSDPGIELAFLVSPALADRFFTTSATWEVRRMNLKSVIQNEVSQKEKNKFIWNLENGTDQPICMAVIETQM